ncbi:hypothetical protein HMPREF9709_00637 [Helcococcus kunzii ATCC 51366]|uniref:Uncharacterized protein n=1 Tax=Helcococcus kunzii ATCC 51366 TaxID=883114 RepID=H3NMS6_9FIRM|nr:PD-(D/E)XK nuclease family protein [Helcococcus kunzii]EHR34667.1 hypothetical protein HMPREF9709_00637 [Helcococcus kunzii ATCC 51366]
MKVLLSRYIRKSKKCFYKKIKEMLDNDQIVYIVVPEQFTLGTEIEAYSELGIKSTLNLRIKSFKTIVNEILHSNGGRALNFISDSAKFVMLQSILFDIKEELRVFQKNIYDKDFIELLIKFIDEMADNMIGLEQLKLMIDHEDTSKELSSKLIDIIKIIEKYNEMKKLSDYYMMDRADLAVEKIKNMANYKDVSFFYYRFHDMSKRELEILSRIDKISNFSLINIIMDSDLFKNKNLNIEDEEVFDISSKFINSLYNPEFNNDIEILNIDNDEKQTSNELFLNDLFTYNLKKVKNKFATKKIDNVFITRANNTVQEVENLAISIKKDIINKDYKYCDIAILTTNSSEYFEKINKIFQINDIPIFLDENRDLLDNAMIKFLKSSLYLIDSNFTTASVVQFLKSSFFVDLEYKINLFISFITRRKIFGRMFFEDKYFTIPQLQKNYIEEDEENLTYIREIRDLLIDIVSFYGNIDEFFDTDKKADYKYFTMKIFNFISNPILLDSYMNYEKTLDEENSNENQLIWDSFIELLENMYNLNSREDISLSRYIDILISAIDNFKIGIIPPSQDQVIVGDVKRSRFNNVKKIYLLGMTSLYYPVPNNDTDIFLDEEKYEMIENGIEIKSVKSSIKSNDLLSFYELLNTASDEIVFSYSLVNGSNEAMNPAFILEWVKAMIPVENNRIEDLDYHDYVYSTSQINKYLPSKILELKENNQISTKEKSFIYGLRKYIEDNNKFKNVNYAINLQNTFRTRKNLPTDLVNKIFNLNKFSVSQLEQYRENPYDHFIKYGIKPREFDEFNISSLDTGNFMHEFLADSINKYFHNNEENIDLENIAEISINKTFENFRTEDNKNIFYINKLKENAENYFNVITKQLDFKKLSNVYLEERYGKYGKFPAINIAYKDKEISLEGKIDRVDEYTINGEKYYSVIDYKTGNKTFNIAKLYYGIDLQLLLYLEAVINSKSNSKPIGAFYQQMNSNLPSSLVDKVDERNELFDDFKLDGVINNNKYVFKIIDENTDVSKVNKSKVFSFSGRKYSFTDKDNVISENDFKKIFKINKDNILESIINISDGDISLKTYKLDQYTPYSYSKYRTISKDFDLKYVYLDKINWYYVKERLEDEDE